jgi:hypothetical protein
MPWARKANVAASMSKDALMVRRSIFPPVCDRRVRPISRQSLNANSSSDVQHILHRSRRRVHALNPALLVTRRMALSVHAVHFMPADPGRRGQCDGGYRQLGLPRGKVLVAGGGEENSQLMCQKNHGVFPFQAEFSSRSKSAATTLWGATAARGAVCGSRLRVSALRGIRGGRGCFRIGVP